MFALCVLSMVSNVRCVCVWGALYALCVWILVLSVNVVVRDWLLDVDFVDLGFERELCSLFGEGGQ